jgi:hypothetical protein
VDVPAIKKPRKKRIVGCRAGGTGITWGELSLQAETALKRWEGCHDERSIYMLTARCGGEGSVIKIE